MSTRVEPSRAGLAILTIFGLVIAMLMVFGGLPARADHVSSWPDSNEANHADFWETWGAQNEGEDDWICIKDETGSDDPYEVGNPPDGRFWRLLVVKAGSDVNDLHWDPSPGSTFEHSVQGGWSHVILCSRPIPEDTTPSTEDTTPTTVEETTTTVGETTTTTIEDEVLGTVITTTTVADEVLDTEVEAEELPFTGVDSELLLGMAVLMLMSGLLVIGLTGRREDV